MLRKKIKPHERLKLFTLFNFRCNICFLVFIPLVDYNGKNTLVINKRWLEIDHITPISKGGLDVFENKQPLCNVCNCKKGSGVSNGD